MDRSKWNKYRRGRIIEALGKGAKIADAAKYGGICERTLHNWLAKGREEEEGEFSRFAERCDRAMIEEKLNLLTIVQKAAVEDWKSAAWLLERRWPKEFGRFTRTEHSGSVGNNELPDMPSLKHLSKEKFEKMNVWELGGAMFHDAVRIGLDPVEAAKRVMKFLDVKPNWTKEDEKFFAELFGE